MNRDLDKLKSLAVFVVESGMTLSASVVGEHDDYELVTYIDSVVIEDSVGNEIVIIDKDDYESEE